MSDKLNIIFLDIDGVLNNRSTDEYAPTGCIGIMDEKVELLQQLIGRTGAKVVLSSDWRLDKDKNTKDYVYLTNKLNNYNIKIFDITPDIRWSERGNEILEWLNVHKVDGWVVLDDIDFSGFYNPEILPHVIITNPEVGLQQSDINLATKIICGDLRNLEELGEL